MIDLNPIRSLISVVDMRGLLKWPNTSFTSVFIVTYYTLNFGLPYT